jgi:hypothetical protein
VLLCAWGYGAVQCTFCNIRITFWNSFELM